MIPSTKVTSSDSLLSCDKQFLSRRQSVAVCVCLGQTCLTFGGSQLKAAPKVFCRLGGWHLI